MVHRWWQQTVVWIASLQNNLSLVEAPCMMDSGLSPLYLAVHKMYVLKFPYDSSKEMVQQSNSQVVAVCIIDYS